MKERIIIIAGPTACGKTATSIELAKKINGEIISADSMQVYKYMDIGTAKVTKEEADGIKHYLIDEFEPDFSYSVAEFANLAKKYIKEIYSKGKMPIIVGGTGFYINALLYNTDFSQDVSTKYRDELYSIYEKNGIDFLYNMLKECDPEACEKIHKNNIKRVIRAIEFFKQTGSKISEHNKIEKLKEPAYDYTLFFLNDLREKLYKKIDMRVDMMINNGLIAEVEKLLNMGYSPNLTSMQGLGYKEIVKYIKGEISKEEAIYILKRDTRHFAKRQITWFKNQNKSISINCSDFKNNIEIADKMNEILSKKYNL